MEVENDLDLYNFAEGGWKIYSPNGGLNVIFYARIRKPSP